MPTVFGSLRNGFSVQRFQLSFTLLYQLGYYFRRSTIDYGRLFNGTLPGHSDYQRRWQSKGDELKTDIPSFQYPLAPYRDQFFAYSEVPVTRGDHVRLQEVRVSYDCKEKSTDRSGFRQLQFYLQAYNLGIVWKANHNGVDPDYLTTYTPPCSLSAGMKIVF